tara:strand:+ start:682 stop:927 length:246 start_codon:yes stop_codon:yes gene_type:complete
MYKFKPNPLKDLVNKFNEFGIFPSDSEMKDAIEGSGVKSLTPEQLELNLLKLAENENHPYHHMVVPKPCPEWVNEWIDTAV